MINNKIKTTRLKSHTLVFVLSIINGISWGFMSIFLFISYLNVGKLDEILDLLIPITIAFIFSVVLFVLQLISIIRKKYIIKHSRIKKGIVLYRNYYQISKFIVEFENDYGKKTRTVFTTGSYYNDARFIEYSVGDVMPLFVYGNYGYYDRSYKIDKKILDDVERDNLAKKIEEAEEKASYSEDNDTNYITEIIETIVTKYEDGTVETEIDTTYYKYGIAVDSKSETYVNKKQ